MLLAATDSDPARPAAAARRRDPGGLPARRYRAGYRHAFPFAIYLIAGIDAVAGGLLRPLRATLTPALARSAEELVAANAVTTTGDALGAMLGPGGAALVLVAGDVPATLVAGTIVMIVALGVVFPIKAAPDISPRTPLRTGEGTRQGA